MDQRLFNAPQDDAEAARLEGAVEQMTARLPEDVKTEVACASTLCRLVLQEKDDARARGAAGAADGAAPAGAPVAQADPPAGAPSGSGSAGAEPTELDVQASHAIADPARDVFYATVGGDTSKHANSLVVVDAASSAVRSSIFVGSQPLTIALPDDASTLRVSLQGSDEIRLTLCLGETRERDPGMRAATGRRGKRGRKRTQLRPH
ncbi:YncE family protein [Sorangium sp. So ce887]|uniref:YncE family protein n=1 Tax=Sorangium sp. So ce887 TaxID=3133324 RepID=UPI003F6402F8